MAKVKELTSEQQVRIKALFDVSWSYRRIAKDFRCSLSTVKYTLDCHDATNSHQNRKRRGRKKKLSDRQVKHLKILHRKLGEEGLFGRIAARKPLLKERNRVKRQKFAKEHKKWTKEDWYKVLWTDESKFEQFGNRRRVYVRRREGARYKT